MILRILFAVVHFCFALLLYAVQHTSRIICDCSHFQEKAKELFENNRVVVPSGCLQFAHVQIMVVFDEHHSGNVCYVSFVQTQIVVFIDPLFETIQDLCIMAGSGVGLFFCGEMIDKQINKLRHDELPS